MKGQTQLVAYYVANGILSMISDNVFVATVYISETKLHFINILDNIDGTGMSGETLMGLLTDPQKNWAETLSGMDQELSSQIVTVMTQFEKLAIAINTGTNIPSIATPNGQAAFLFLLTSTLAPVIKLSYGRMVVLALPYTITMSISGLLATYFFL